MYIIEMNKIRVTPNFLRNADQIVDHVKRFYSDKFSPREGDDRHTGIIPGVYSKFSTLKDVNMERQLIDLIFDDNDFDSDLKDFYSFIQIQKYEKNDYICPHFDVYGSLTKLHLITLTSSDTDALIIEDGNGGLIRVPDQAGQYIDFDNSLFHWVNPVVEERFTMVIAE
jgi:hypothetical protein